MKNSTQYRAFFLSAAFLTMAVANFATAQTAATTATLIVHLHGLRNDIGAARVGLYNTKSSFAGEKPYKGASSPVKNGVSVVEFENIPFGDYALAVLHDENGNNKMDFSVFGPAEQYGFSNDARRLLSAPSFEEARVRVQKSPTTITINLK